MTGAASAPQATPVPLSDRFTTVPKIREICPAGVPAHLLPTYAAIADYANNTTGICWPRMGTIAWLLGKSLRTVQRHVHQLEELGLLEILHRRRDARGRFLGYKFRLPHIAAAALRVRERREANKKRHDQERLRREESRKRRRRERLSKKLRGNKPSSNAPAPIPISGEEGERRRRESYEWLFAKGRPSEAGPYPGRCAPAPQDEPPPEDLLAEHPQPAPEQEEAVPPEHTSFAAEPTGQPRPVVPIIRVTSSNNHYPPNPPEPEEPAGQQKPSEDGPPAQAEGSGGARPFDPPELPGELEAWCRLCYALLELHPDLDLRFLRAASLSLDAPRAVLRVQLRDVAIVRWYGAERRVVGRSAERTRRLYGPTLARLWREISERDDATLELVSP